MERIKPHLLDYSMIAKVMDKIYEENNELIKNSLFFQTLLRIAEYTDNKMGLFLMFLKSKNVHVFDIINNSGKFQILI